MTIIPSGAAVDWQPLRSLVLALPAFPSDGVCPHCHASAWQVIEEGYCRWSNAHFEEGVLTAFSDGWDDMSEGNEVQWIECNPYNATDTGCGAAFQFPDEMEWT